MAVVVDNNNIKLCYQIHQERSGCEYPIPIREKWRYCPACGRATGHINKPDGSFQVEQNNVATRQVALRNVGVSAVAVVISLEKLVEGLQFGQQQRRNLVISPGMAENISLQIPSLTDPCSTFLGYLCIESQDGEKHKTDDPWSTAKARVTRVPLTANLEIPAIIRAVQEILLFREGISERTLELVNDGTMPGEVVDIRTPPGYAWTGDLSRISGGMRLSFTIRRDWGVSVEDYSQCVVTTADDQQLNVILYSFPQKKVQEVPHAIIGIDFGTAFTSIAFRECRNHRHLQDDVTFLRPPGETDDRYRTRMWIGNDGDIAFLSKANELYEENPAAGYLILEMKTLLRLNDDEDAKIYIYPERRRSVAIQFLKGRYGAAWQEMLVTEYLRWLYRSTIQPELKYRFEYYDVNVKYVFSIPVLDYATDKTQYEMQVRKMESCVINAGFPKECVEFQLEPVCAALGLMYYPQDSDLPRLGSPQFPICSGDRLAVFDSGGGTTDVVVAEADVDAQNQSVKLRIERCLGQDHDASTFGGEEITTGVELALRGKLRETIGSDWYKGELNWDAIFSSESGNSDSRTKAEKIKIELAANNGQAVSKGRIVIYPLLLDKLAIPKLRSLDEALLDYVFTEDSRSTVRYYMAVGGNTYIPYVGKWISKFMQDDQDESNRRLKLPDRYRNLAVAYGSVWVPDARIQNAVPYELHVIAGNNTLLILPKDTSQEIIMKYRSFQLPHHASMTLNIKIVLHNKAYSVQEYLFSNPYDQDVMLDTWTDLQQGELRISMKLRDIDEDDRTPAVIKYKL